MDRLDALAIERLRESGVKFTVDSLCKEAKCSKKTFYVLYPSKGDFAKHVYHYAYAQYEAAASSFHEHPSRETLEHLLSWAMDVMMITSQTTFNLYSMSALLQKAALQERAKIKTDFVTTLSNTFPPSVTDHRSFFYALEKTLVALSHEKNREAILHDLSEVLAKWMR